MLIPNGPELRSCSRCGVTFLSAGRQHCCDQCRGLKPVRAITRDGLSFRELQIVALIKQAKSNKVIAFELHLSEGTIKEYVKRIFRKLDVSSRMQLVLQH